MPTRTDPLAPLAVTLSGFSHPLRIRLLVLMEQETSPRDLALITGEPLGVVAYHVRMLRTYSLIEETRTEPRRGALAHFYVRTPAATKMLATLAPQIGAPKRGPGRVNKERRTADLEAWARG